MKILLIVFCCFLSPFKTIAQTTESSDTLHWSPCYKLKMEDFKGRPDTTKIALANSYIQIRYTYEVVNNRLQFNINCYFLKNLSWSKYNMPEIMDHEQAHFDVAKLFALQLEQKFRDYKVTRTVDGDLKTLYNMTIKEQKAMHDLYDKIERENPETAIPQKKFEAGIRKQLPACKK